MFSLLQLYRSDLRPIFQKTYLNDSYFIKKDIVCTVSYILWCVQIRWQHDYMQSQCKDASAGVEMFQLEQKIRVTLCR